MNTLYTECPQAFNSLLVNVAFRSTNKRKRVERRGT